MHYRTLIFLILLCLFLLTTPALILYSQGYRIDFNSFSLVQTGGLFVKTNPENAVIFLDNKGYSATSRFLGTKFIQNLLPKEYTLEIAKAGFMSWKKKIKIQERQTNEFRDILLIPQEPKDIRIAESIEALFINEERDILISLTRTEKSNDLTFTRIRLNSPTTSDLFTFRGVLNAALSSPITIDDAVLQDRALFHSTSLQKKQIYFLADFAAMNIKLMPIKAPGTVHAILFHPSDPNFLIAHIEDTLWLVDTSDYSFIPLKEKVAFFTIRNAQGFLVEKNTNIIIGFTIENPDTPTRKKMEIAEEHVFFREILPEPYLEGTFDIFKNSSVVILLANDTYLWNPQDAAWEILVNDIAHMRRIGAEEYLAWNDNTVWLFSKEKNGGAQLLSPKLAARYQNPIGNVYPFGMPASSIIFAVGNRIEIRELSFDNQENTVPLPIKTKKFFFDQKTGVLYFIRDENLYQSYLYP